MKYVFFFIVYILQFFFFYMICEDMDAAPIIIKKGKFRLAYLLWIKSDHDPNKHRMKFAPPLPPWDQIYHFCPSTAIVDDSSSTSALQLAEVNRNLHPASICSEIPNPVVVRVLNAEKFRKYWRNNIEWYVNGFKIDSRKIIENLNIPSQQFDTGFLYESIAEGEVIVPGYSVFYDTTIKQIIAAEYKLFPANMYEPDFINFSPLSYIKIEIPDLSKYDKFFEDELYIEVYKVNDFTQTNLPDRLKQVALISPPHFIYWFYKRQTWYNVNLIPMWSKFAQVYQKINTFLETVAQKIGKLKIASGISGLGSTDKERKQRTYLNSKNNSEYVVSDFLWKVVEFKHMKEIYGIILVQINTLSEPSYKICKEDVCSKYKWLLRSADEKNIVYCCNMTAKALKKLEMPFLNFEKRREFDLTFWGFGTGGI